MAKRRRRLGVSAGMGKHPAKRMTDLAIGVELHHRLADHINDSMKLQRRDCELMQQLIKRQAREISREKLIARKVAVLKALVLNQPVPPRKPKLITKIKRLTWKLKPEELDALRVHIYNVSRGTHKRS